MTRETLGLFKTLADETRLRILCSLSERDLYTELLAERLCLSPATVSFHMKKLMQAGLVDARREQYYTVYSLKKDLLSHTLMDFIGAQGDDKTAEQLREEQYRRKVLNTFMPGGVCTQMPAQLKKRLIVYREIFNRFDPRRTYTEKEVNAVISEMHEDYCTVRRGFVGMGWMHRDKGIYSIDPNPDFENSSGALS